MAEIKFEIAQHIGVLSETAKGGLRSLAIFVGTIKTQSMTFVSGHLIMLRWGKV